MNKTNDSRTLLLRKTTQRRCDLKVLRSQLEYLIERAAGGNRKLWVAKLSKISEVDSKDVWVYSCRIALVRDGRRIPKAVEDGQFDRIKYILSKAGNASRWLVEGYATDELPTKSSDEAVPEQKPFAEIKKPKAIGDSNKFFEGLYGFDNHRLIIDEAIETARRTGFEQRRHIILYGPPGCGKTRVIECYKAMLGREAYLEMDATMSTQAGAVKMIDDRMRKIRREIKEAAAQPPILFVEEIEKAQGESLQFLLGILDDRAEIKKVTFRQTIDTEAPCLLIGNANDEVKLQGFMSGALKDRVLLLYCPPPSDEIKEKILMGEIARMKDGNPEWARRTIDFCRQYMPEATIRCMISLATIGKEKWLTGEFEKAVLATMPPRKTLNIAGPVLESGIPR